MNFTSKPVTLNASRKKVYEFLTDFNNFERLMPEQVTNWQSDKETCSFTIEGMADIKLKYTTKNPYSTIKVEPDGKSPISFDLHINLEESPLDEQKAIGIDPNMIRLSVGIEHIDDIKADLNNAAKTIEIRFTDRNASKASDVVNTLAEELKDYDREKKQESANNIIAFIDEQLGLLKDSLVKSETELEKFKRKFNIDTLSILSEKDLRTNIND